MRSAPSLPRVLLIDDEKDNLEALARLLRRDFEITLAASGEEGLEILAQKRFEAIVSDQRMPGISGSEFFERAQKIDPEPTRILLTGFADLESVIEAINRGHIWRYVAKPWEPDDLKITLQQAVERTRLTRSLADSRRELERVLVELRARDWARERLFQILLHEFRTAPQILENLKQLDPGGAESEVRLRFMDNLQNRFGVLESEITNLLSDEKATLALPKEDVALRDLLEAAAAGTPAIFTDPADATPLPQLPFPRAALLLIFRHLIEILTQNTAGVPPAIRIELNPGPRPTLFIVLQLRGPVGTRILPSGLSKQDLEPTLAWSLLLEPFVGAGDFAHHSTGLRTHTARYVRQLASLGIRAEFQVSGKGDLIELILSFRLPSPAVAS